jgi:peptidoglycan/xylan/chitin deacetylase (PgdA/CDA1 family)
MIICRVIMTEIFCRIVFETFLKCQKTIDNFLSTFIYFSHTSTEGERNLNMESLYDYGAHAGFWRLHRLFTRKKVPATVFAVGMALERNPGVCHVLKETADWEVASHGYRWLDYSNCDEETEKDHLLRTIEIHERLLGKRPVYLILIPTGRVSENTVDHYSKLT